MTKFDDALSIIGLRRNLPSTAAVKSMNPIAFQHTAGVSGVGRNADLPPDKIGAAMAFSNVSPVNRAGNLWGSGIDAVNWTVTDLETDEVVGSKDDWRVEGTHPAARAIREVRRASGDSLFFRWGVSRAIPGENYIELIRNDTGYPRALRWLNPLGVTKRLTGGGEIIGFQYNSMGSMEFFDPSSVSYDRSFSLVSDIDGLSPAMAAMFENNILRNVMRTWMAQFRNGAVPGGMIVPKSLEADVNSGQMVGFTAEEADYIRTTWASRMKGVENTGSVIVPGKPIDFIQFPAPDYAKQIPMDDTMRTAIYTAFGISLPVAGDVRGLQYKAGQEIFGLFVAGVLTPQLSAIQDEVNATIMPFFTDLRSTRWGSEPGRYRFAFDLTVFDDTTEAGEQREAAALSRYAAGISTFNETRIVLGLDPIDGGDQLALPSGLTFVPVNDAFSPAVVEDETVALPPGTDEQANQVIGDAGKPTDKPPIKSETSSMSSGVYTETFSFLPEPDEDPPLDVSTVLTQWHADATNELRQWRKSVKNKTKRGFVPRYLPETVVHLITEALTHEDFDASSAFDNAGEILRDFSVTLPAVKALSATQAEFIDTFRTNLDMIQLGDTDRRRWAVTARRLLRQFGTDAYFDGLEDGGIEVDGAKGRAAFLKENPEDKAMITSMLKEQSKYVTGLGLILKEGIGVGEAANKPLMWFNKAITPFYAAGLLSASRNQMMEFVGDDGEESCTTCRRLKGQRHRAKAWSRKGLWPRRDTGNFDCNGFQCQHTLVPTPEPARGTWLRDAPGRWT